MMNPIIEANKSFIMNLRARWVADIEIDGPALTVTKGFLKEIAGRLYSTDAQFLLELIQNADDSNFSADVSPEATCSFETERIIFSSNEAGFKNENVEAICQPTHSTKSKNKFLEVTQTGEKGLGFRSVFRVSDAPEIHSGGFHFCFNTNGTENWHNDMGMVVPEWIDEPWEFSDHLRTVFVLPLKIKDIDLQFSRKMFCEVKVEMLMFLRKLRRLTLKDLNRDCAIVFDFDSNDSRPAVTVRKKTFDQGKISEEGLEFELYKHVADMKDVVEKTRASVEESEVKLVFKLNQGEVYSRKDAFVFATLPICPTSLGFVINADFILTTNRGSIDKELQWNLALREAAATLLSKTILQRQMNNPEDFSALSLLSKFEPITPDFFEPLLGRALDLLKNEKSIYTTCGKWVLPAQVLLPDELIPYDLIPNDRFFQIVNTFCVSQAMSGQRVVLHKLGVGKFDINKLLDCLSKPWVQKMPVEWFGRLYQFIGATKDWSESQLNRIKKIQLIRLEGGAVVSGELGNVTKKESVLQRFAFETNVPTFDSSTLAGLDGDSLKNAQMGIDLLGVHKDRALALLKYIASRHKEEGWLTTTTRDEAVEHIQFLLLHRDKIEGLKSGDSNLFNDIRRVKIGDSSLDPSNWVKICGAYLDAAFGGSIYTKIALGERAEGLLASKHILALDISGNQADKNNKLPEFLSKLGASFLPRPSAQNNEKGWEWPIFKLIEQGTSEQRVALLCWIGDYWDVLKSVVGKSSAHLDPVKKMVITIGENQIEVSKLVQDTPNNRETFGDTVGYLPKSVNSEFASVIGCPLQPDASSLLNGLRSLSGLGITSTVKDRAEKFYRHLLTLPEIEPNIVKLAFTQSELTIASREGNLAWMKIDDVVWECPEPLQGITNCFVLKELWLGLEDFWLVRNKVTKQPSGDQLVDCLRNLVGHDDFKFVSATARHIYKLLNNYYKNLDTSRQKPNWLAEIRKNSYLYCRNKSWRSFNQDVFFNDHIQFGDEIENAGKISILDLEAGDIKNMRNFLMELGCCSLKDSAILEPSINFEKKEWASWIENKLRFAKNIARIWASDNGERSEQFRAEGILQAFQKIKDLCVWQQSPVSCILSVNKLSIAIESGACIIDGVAMVDPNKTTHSLELGCELARIINLVGREKGQTIEKVLVSQNDEELEEAFKQLHINKLSKEEEALLEGYLDNPAVIINSTSTPTHPLTTPSTDIARPNEVSVLGSIANTSFTTQSPTNGDPIPSSITFPAPVLSDSITKQTKDSSSKIDTGYSNESSPLIRNFVHTSIKDQHNELDADSQQTKNLTSAAAMKFVMQFELDNGRVPRDMNIECPNHSGFDIESTSSGCAVRRIEVKGLSGNWRGYDVQLTMPQFGDAWQAGQNAWLYVVENANTSPVLHRIRNFTRHENNRFIFHSSWKAQAEGAKSVEPNGRQPAKGTRIINTTGRIGTIFESNIVKEFDTNQIIIHWENSSETTNTMWNPVEYKIL